MGNEFVIYEWRKESEWSSRYCLVYEGNSLIKAIFTVLQIRYKGCNCIKIMYRPDGNIF